ncbi:endoplasmic reticulum metallopeptidase 1-like [Ischnura elegans]|uniref:endoplasmic reticulum metallopeptidase 1-like n=1 Tax=Ischnura elegans TaxID=197161 RepID=UPI001ED8AA02|nr:endoplasmic reticulum metallopeptidase 1-like [Ischnura elegans]
MYDKARRGLRLRVKSSASEEENHIIREPSNGSDGRYPLGRLSGHHICRSLYLPPFSPIALIVSFACFALLTAYILAIHMHLPEPILVESEKTVGGRERFIAGRAARHLSDLTALGPRPTGSRENEELAARQLERKAREFARAASPVHRVEVDVQHPSGSFPLRFLDGLTNVYHNVQNVIVRISPADADKRSPYSLLVNCHFDTVADSPGASDDGASCAIMMEILRVITQSNRPVTHSLILLFNGAEENLMQASHGFITKHPWAKDIQVFINLEACGAGGREILFQAGPGQPWILTAYAESVPHPYASSLAQEIFESGIIPGDTDFRIFRDFGNISGLDFAWSSNGYVYHTSLDAAAAVPAGTLQRTGDNILALVRHLTSSPELAHSKKDNHARSKAGQPVYFDILGIGVVRWPMVAGDAISFASIAGAIISVVSFGLVRSRDQGLAFRVSIRELGLCILVQLGSCLLSLVAATLISTSLSLLGRTMSWFARPIWIGVLYVIPTLLTQLLLILVVAKWQKKVLGMVWTVFWKYFDAALILWSALLAVTVVFRLRSGYVICAWVLFPAIVSYLLRLIPGLRDLRDWRWLMLYLALLVPPFVITSYLVVGVLSLFIPIMGRIGSATNPDAIVAVLTVVPYSLILTYMTPLVVLVRRPGVVLTVLGSVFALGFALICLTPLGFPYSGDARAPAPLRIMMIHSERKFHDIQGNVRRHETGYWLVDMDHNSPDVLRNKRPDLLNGAVPVEGDCAEELYCGMPYLMPVLTFIWKTHWIPGPPISLYSNDTTLELLSREFLPNGGIRLTFNATGPDHMGLMLSPVHGVELKGWKLMLPDESETEPLSGPQWNGRETYFVYYGRASSSQPWIFSLDLKFLGGRKAGSFPHVIDVGLTGHLMHGHHKVSPEFRAYIKRFPEWTVVTAWTASYKSWYF